MKKIGITTTIPVEVIFASGNTPIDLNNIVVSSSDMEKHMETAEREGFPKSMCAWIKGIFGVCINEGVSEVVGVVEGDCSNTASLIEILKLHGINVVDFSYPRSRKLPDLKKKIQSFMDIYEVSEVEVEWWRLRLNIIREKVKELDELTKEGKVSSYENHLFQVSCSDFWGNPNKFEAELEKVLHEARSKKEKRNFLKLAYLGVPPMTSDFYDYIETKGAKIVFNEVQREFTFPRYQKAKNIYEQYLDYTYPYSMDFRLMNLEKDLDERDITGIIHYTQKFCHRALDNIVLKEKLPYPLINIESDRENKLDERTKIRLDAFIEMLKEY